MSAPQATKPPPAADPALIASICDLLADMLRRRAASRADEVATLQRLVAELSAALAAKTRDEADEQLTVKEAAALAGRSEECIRDWCRGVPGLARLDPDAHKYRISLARLRAQALRLDGRLPAALAE